MPVRRTVAGRRILEQRGTDHRHHEEGRAEDLERRAPADVRHEPAAREGAEDRRTAAVAADHQADDETAAL